MSFNPHTFNSDVFLFIQRQGLIQENESLLLAVSGGLDSMAMLHFFQRYSQKKFNTEFAVAHFEHQIHPQSKETQQWLKDFCEQQKITFFTHCENIPQKLKESPQSSLEAVARDYRYQWLYQIAEQYHFKKIVTAHTASDQCELIFMRLARGGVSGISGMKAYSLLQDKYALIRPFLKCTRIQLEAYIAHYQIAYMEDPTNQELDFFRNRVRHQLIPFLLEENPRLEAHLTELSEIWTDEQDYLEKQAKTWFELYCFRTSVIEIPVNIFKELHVALQRRVIRQALTEWQGNWRLFTSKHIEAIRKLSDARPGKSIQLPKGLVVQSMENGLVFKD